MFPVKEKNVQSYIIVYVYVGGGIKVNLKVR